ncbi:MULTISPECIES: amino acid ABC transporter ATP-binding protein [unclassified Oceanispirochaeta]|uniref:amino acid ABC transporter ATP-binding protein n=1 Tax=unclassified Oceanispirochaeta TaxID=2635722 RepID=UPI000E0916E7|nr:MULTISPECIES: ATP-binding cassette domain-containing protein [unclassified Oceanispirochaeta]MBF9016955.1 amino acid ABC transporter ATP-binding protein [Oceanispirochaeta sp. M2]NPD73318.1 amino acid ABC transporter ATP-binding protein [Oceanispirochaeta sp. M1]RDG30980.1 amino acid ABC transporter ATP-binding protein [Oceanispirochaeta sp. M1]
MNINLNGVSKSYDKQVLDNIDLELNDYNTLAVIGKSGCGKSTLLRLMTGIEEADSGDLVVNGYEVRPEKLKEYQSHIGMVFQQHNLFPHLTLLQNITLILEKTRHMQADEARFTALALLTQLHLEDEVNKKPRFVSGGQAQRASIARALSTDPELVFLDEPTASLDPILTKEVLDTVLDLKDRGTKFIFVTHEINFVRQFAEYVLFMDEGSIAEQGEVGILDNPQTEKLQNFLENERSMK